MKIWQKNSEDKINTYDMDDDFSERRNKKNKNIMDSKSNINANDDKQKDKNKYNKDKDNKIVEKEK